LALSNSTSDSEKSKVGARRIAMNTFFLTLSSITTRWLMFSAWAIALAGARDPSSNDWTLTWIRRTREGGEWRDNVDASLGESSQVYQIDVFSDGTYATVKRTITTSTPDASYSSADQVTDFGANQATLYLKIYQLSSVVGRGYPLTQSLTG
jgi:hypothetical protein